MTKAIRKKNKAELKICINAIAILLIVFFFIGHGFAAEIKLSLTGLKLTREETAWLKSTKSIKIGGPRAFPPFHYFDDQGHLKGISADYIFAIMNTLGVKLEVQNNLPWPEVLEKAKSGEIDLIPCAAKTVDRQVYLNYSSPYLSFPLVILTSKNAPFIGGIEDLHGKTLAIINRNIISTWLKRDKIKFEPYYVKSPLKKLEAISFGIVDAGIENLATAIYTIQKQGLTNVKIAAPTQYENYNLHIAVRKDLPELLGVINKVIDLITPEQHAQIRNKWLSVRYEYGISKADILKWILTISIFSLIIIVIVLFWNRKLKKAKGELKESERRLSTLIGNLPGIAYRCQNDPDWTMLYISKGCYELTGYEPFELEKNRILSYGDLIVEADRQFVIDEIQTAVEESRSFAIEYRIRSKNNNIKWVWEKGQSLFDKKNNLMALEGFITDITDRKQTEEALRASDKKYQFLFMNAQVALFRNRLSDGKVLEINERYAKMAGYSDIQDCMAEFNAADAWVDSNGRKKLLEILQKNGFVSDYETEIIRRDGDTIWISFSATIFSEQGFLEGSIVDITERKRSEIEQEKLQAQLIQAQRIESVGRLAGGVAHDFNNMLGVILGNTEILMEDIDPSNPLITNLEEIHKAAERSANLTKQLLAFARKQTIDPKILNLNHVLDDMLKMLKHLIGEDIDLTWQPSQNLWSVKIDPSQIDQILVNLCVNARDAIKSVGKITIETNNSSFDEAYCKEHADFNPGDYVMMAVSDNGSGMDQKILDNLFEPFFTTKDIGRGTGLGLATVYGIVKQNDGFINVYSEPGEGTTFKIYLPVYAETAVPKQKTFKETSLTGNETILLVEDEKAILMMTQIMLERLGYTVLTASAPNEAISIVEASNINAIHLLITDVVMPEMNGRDLSKKLLSIHHGLKCLFMSGYTANVIAHHGVLDTGVQFINKPFSKQDLAAKVRDLLDKGK